MAASFSINRQWLSPPSGDMKIEGREGSKLCVGTDGLPLRARGASQELWPTSAPGQVRSITANLFFKLLLYFRSSPYQVGKSCYS